MARVYARAAQKLPDMTDGGSPLPPKAYSRLRHRFRHPLSIWTSTTFWPITERMLPYVYTPHDLHAPPSIAALEAGVPVMVEKLRAMNAAETEAMVATSRRSGAFLMVAHCWHFDPEVWWLR
ncbi:MAG: Gfo/Idh/MocA family oxidoreductase [Anaerolineae bacterium]|nr:Gfo/Idh/MocA family oxidoreductase [Anaerolineae bacterium]MDW8067613.1 Gfo/Idh/MocA family oxidoreductase [Anaerolineae bacterium]